MKNKLKDSKGVVSVFAMLAMLFFLLFIIGAYIGVSRANKIQREANKELLELYSTSVDPQAIYNDMIADADEVIPVYEYDDLPTNRLRYKSIDGKLYFLTPKSGYELKTNLIIPPGSSLYENVYLSDYQYSCVDSQKLMLDGDNNSGTGHDSKLQTAYGYTRYAVWRNLMNTADECNIYGGGNIRAYVSGVTWDEDSLVVDGSGMHVVANNILDENSTQETVEMVFKTNSSTRKQYIFSNASLSVGITPKSGNGVFFIEYENDGVVVTQETSVTVTNNKVYSIAATYNGSDVKLYINGVSVLDAQNFETTPLEFSTTPYKYKVNKFAVGINTYIGTVADNTSTAGITVSPYFVSGYPITPTYRIKNDGNYDSKITNTTTGNSHWAKDLFLNFADLNKSNYYSAVYGLTYNDEGEIKNQDISFSNFSFGASFVDGKLLDIIAKGSDSVIIRSNVGQIQNWSYKKGSGNYTNINPTKEVLTLGNWYYSFDHLDSNTSSGIRYSFKGEYKLDANNLLDVDASSLYIGRRYNVTTNDSLGGQIYAVRAYDIALTEDNIQTNFRIDKTKYGIN